MPSKARNALERRRKKRRKALFIRLARKQKEIAERSKELGSGRKGYHKRGRT